MARMMEGTAVISTVTRAVAECEESNNEYDNNDSEDGEEGH